MEENISTQNSNPQALPPSENLSPMPQKQGLKITSSAIIFGVIILVIFVGLFAVIYYANLTQKGNPYLKTVTKVSNQKGKLKVLYNVLVNRSKIIS